MGDVDDQRVFTGRVVAWDARDERLMKDETMIHVIIQDADIHNGRIPIGRFIEAVEAAGGE